MVKKAAPAATNADEATDTKSARTRQRILDAAANVLSRKGYAGTRLSEVADIADLQTPAIYYYFPSRDDLVEEVMWSGIAGLKDVVASVLADLPADTPPIERIMAAVETHLRHELEVSDYATASIRNSGQIPEKMRTRQKEEDAAYGNIWRELFTDAADAGDLNPGLHPVIAQLLVVGALNWAAEWWSRSRGSVDDVVQNAQLIIRNGLSPVRG
ncbi:MAG: TetR/AcrR family transcriptional regulator [Nocardiaceae bacterium]|nr:TetR/AcrR family transcriptional regulator [Nocardiaceae bacterium]